jgi:hypothetical protein
LPTVAAPRQNGQQAAAAIPVVPFVAAAHEHTERAFATFSVTPGATVQQFQFDLPAYGYLRHVWLIATGSGGTGGTAAADAPWNLFSNITLLDTNGAPIFGPLDGYATYIANVIGGYAFNQDPADMPNFVGTAPNLAFAIRIPVEISHYDGMGSLANQNAAAPYRLALEINTAGNLYSVAPSPATAYSIQGFIECWSLPNEVDGLGRGQAQIPPNHGTVQYWSSRNVAVAVGDNKAAISRVGNVLRNIVVIARNASGVRVDTVFPDPAILNWDARQMFNDSQAYRINALAEKINGWQLGATGATGRPVGVFAYPLDHSVLNRAGDDKPTLWYPTVQATRLEVAGSSAVAGSLQLMVNDIAPAEINPAERYELTSATGFQPNADVRQVVR